ncbi:MAG TPA: cytochrome c [Roseiarcus sp.]|nr:cytochrome c [Roseiarcus sp.]
MTARRRPLTSLAALVLSLVALAPASAQDAAKPYAVKDGMVDKGTYNGYRRYGDSCLRCHGPDAAGSSYAPDLTRSLSSLSEDQFKDVVINGRINVSAASNKVMPSFGEVEDVVLYLDDIYAYVKARSDDAIGRGRPERFDR